VESITNLLTIKKRNYGCGIALSPGQQDKENELEKAVWEQDFLFARRKSY
jgi:hypothetical protein